MNGFRDTWSRLRSRLRPPHRFHGIAPAILSLCIFAVGLYTAVVTGLIVYRTYSPVILWDQWEYVDIALHSNGWPPLSRLFAQWNEHRNVIGRILGLIDLQWLGGRNVSLVVEIYLAAACLTLVLIWMVRRVGQLDTAASFTAMGVISFCAFCPVQIDDFTWYFEVAFVFAGLAAVASFAGVVLHASRMASDSRRWLSAPLVISMVAALAAEYSEAQGLLAWPILVVLVFALRFPRRTRTLVAVAGTLAISAYFWHYQTPAQLGNPWQSLRHPMAIAGYVIGYFATSWNALLPPESAGYLLSGFLTILAIAAAIAAIIKYLFLPRARPDLLCAFLAAIMLFALSGATITALGRIRFGVPQASVSRYQCVALMFWSALAILLLIWAGSSPARLALLQAVLLAMMTMSAARFGAYEKIARGRQVRIGRAYVALVRNPADQAAARALNPGVNMMPLRVGYLRSHGLGPDPDRLEAQLPIIPWPASRPNWAGYKPVPQDRCLGWFDGLEPGVRQQGLVVATGWAWDKEAYRPPRKVVFALPNGMVVGTGQTMIPREDVPGVLSKVTDINTGWEGIAAAPQGSRLRAFAVLDDGTSICPLPPEVAVGPDQPQAHTPVPPPRPIPSVAGYKRVQQDSCLGWFDTIKPGVGHPDLIVATGWAWDREAHKPPRKVLFVLPNGRVVGFGHVGNPRGDVPGVVGEVTDINTGWEGQATAPHGAVLRAFSVQNDGSSICPLQNEATVP